MKDIPILFLKEFIDILIYPKLYFIFFPENGNYRESIIKAFVYGFVLGIINIILCITKSLSKDCNLIQTLFAGILFAIVFLLIGGFVLKVISALLEGNTNYALNIRIVATIMFLIPLSALLHFFDDISNSLETVFPLLIILFGIWIIYNALIYRLSTNVKHTRIITIMITLIIILTIIARLGTKESSVYSTESYKGPFEEINNYDHGDIIPTKKNN